MRYSRSGLAPNTITDFILARIADDEADAQNALERGFGGWEWLADHGINHEARTHIVCWHPARVLAECEAKRRIVTLLNAIRCELPASVELGLFDIASVYSDHPDYRPEWGC